MKRLLSVVGIALAVALVALPAGAGPNVKAGKWEITVTTEMTGMPNMPNMKVPPQIHTQCLKEGDLVPQSEEAAKECKISDMKVTGNTVSWSMSCSGKGGEVSGTGEVTYQGDTLKGSMQMEMKGAGMKIKNTLSGRRIGDCG